jgi:hypothetical protein
MKFRITMKDPDGPYESIQEAAKEMVNAIKGIDADERESLQEKRHETLSEFAGRWMEYGEYLEVEFDTEAGTATVIRRNK